jgi:hypothetical protein
MPDGFWGREAKNKHKHKRKYKAITHSQETHKATTNNQQEHTRYYVYQGHLTTRDVWG